MALLDSKSGIWGGLALGMAVLVAPVVVPVIAVAARPLVKGAIKNGYLLYQRGREIVAEVVESIEDLTAEAKSEADFELASSIESTGGQSPSEPLQRGVQ